MTRARSVGIAVANVLAKGLGVLIWLSPLFVAWAIWKATWGSDL